MATGERFRLADVTTLNCRAVQTHLSHCGPSVRGMSTSSGIAVNRSVLILEGLWDQLESTINLIRSSETQPDAWRIAQGRIASYRTRLHELLAKWGERELRSLPQDQFRIREIIVTALSDVADLIGLLEVVSQPHWIDTLCQAQDVVLGALHDLRGQSAAFVWDTHSSAASVI